MLLQECQLTPEQQGLVPEYAQNYPTYRLSSNHIPWKVATSNALMRRGGGSVLALSSQALVIRSRRRVPSDAYENFNNNSNRFEISDLGDIVATDNRAAAAALLQVAGWAVDGETWDSVIVRRHASDRSLPLTDAELEQLLLLTTTMTKSRWISFFVDWTPAQLKVVANMGPPISWSLPRCMEQSQPLLHCFFNALLERTTSFGRLQLPVPPPLPFCQQLAQRPTRLLDHLDLTLEAFHDDASSYSNANIVTLLQCRRSIASLCIWIRADNDGFYQAVAAAVAAGRCPLRLQFRRVTYPFIVPAIRSVVQALASPRCALREVNVFDRASMDLWRNVLQQNASLEHLVFQSISLFAFADQAVWQAIVRHPRLVRVTVDDAIWRTTSDRLAAFLARWLVRKRQLRIVFHQGSGWRSWERALAPAQRFNRFHCGVVDLLDNTTTNDPTRGRRLWALAVRHAVHDPARLGLLLHHHHTPLLSIGAVQKNVQKKARLCV